MGKLIKTKPRFKVGDWVFYPFVREKIRARILEDRGQLGHQGRRLYRIEIQLTDCEPDRFEAAEEDLTPAAPPAKVS